MFLKQSRSSAPPIAGPGVETAATSPPSGGDTRSSSAAKAIVERVEPPKATATDVPKAPLAGGKVNPASSAAKSTVERVEPPKPAARDAPRALPDTETNAGDDLRYVKIPAGSFEMGCSPSDSECSPDEKPRHRVTISKSFQMGETEVTVAAYRKFAEAKGKTAPSGEADHPVVNVSWDDAKGYCEWAGGRLPAEAEWEYATRAGSTEARYGNLDAIAWYGGNSGGRTHPVKKKLPNQFGLYDMLGNAWEWCSDWYDENYYGAKGVDRDPRGPASGTLRSLRGGSWDVNPRNVRVSLRVRNLPGFRYNYIGFRCVRE